MSAWSSRPSSPAAVDDGGIHMGPDAAAAAAALAASSPPAADRACRAAAAAAAEPVLHSLAMSIAVGAVPGWVTRR